MTTPNIVIGVVGGFVTVNGYACVKSTGVQLAPSMVKQIKINGTRLVAISDVLTIADTSNPRARPKPAIAKVN